MYDYIALLLIGIIIARPLFFFWRWIFRRRTKVERTRKISTWIATLVSIPIIYLLMGLVFIFVITYYPNHDFDMAAWKMNTEKRYEYTKDLIENKLLIGKSKEQVIEMLGKGNNTLDSDDWLYDIGFVPGLFNIDPSNLQIKFKDGVVVSVKQFET